LAISPTTLIGIATVIGGIIGLLAGGAIADALIGRYPGARVLVSGWSFIISLPFFIGAMVSLINGAYMAPLYHTPTGQKMLASGVVMIVIGSLMLTAIAFPFFVSALVDLHVIGPVALP